MFKATHAVIALVALSACDPNYTPPPEVARVEHAFRSYPVLDTPYGWKVKAGGDMIPCRRDTEKDCYWSLRNFVSARIKQDDME